MTTVIKRYANRKLYNTRTSQYVTLTDLCDMVRHGEEFDVIDNRTGEFITAATLTQALHEEKLKSGKFGQVADIRREIIGTIGHGG